MAGIEDDGECEPRRRKLRCGHGSSGGWRRRWRRLLLRGSLRACKAGDENATESERNRKRRGNFQFAMSAEAHGSKEYQTSVQRAGKGAFVRGLISAANEIGGFLGNHDYRSVGVAGDDRGHDGRVHHAQALNAADSQM